MITIYFVTYAIGMGLKNSWKATRTNSQTNALESIDIENGFEMFLLLGFFEVMFAQISI